MDFLNARLFPPLWAFLGATIINRQSSVGIIAASREVEEVFERQMMRLCATAHNREAPKTKTGSIVARVALLRQETKTCAAIPNLTCRLHETRHFCQAFDGVAAKLTHARYSMMAKPAHFTALLALGSTA